MRHVRLVLLVAALAAGGCGSDDGPADGAPTTSTSTTSTSTTSTAGPTTTSSPMTSEAPDPCAEASPFATEANLDGDGRPDLVDAGWVCLGTGELIEWDDPYDVPGDRVAWGSDVDADGIDEVVFFTHSEPPVTARIYELDVAMPELRPVLDGERVFEPVYSHYTGPADPAGEEWVGCTDLDGSGVERLAVGSFVFDPERGETTWTLRPVTWGDDLVIVRGEAVTGSFPAWEEDPDALMPGRRFCKVDELSRRIADGCSAEGLEPPVAPSALPGPAAATFTAIVSAAVACDFNELERIAGDDITLSFGGHNDVAAFLAWGEYGDDRELLRILVELLGMEPASHPSDPDLFVWPGFFATDAPATAEERIEIEAIYGRPWDDVVGDVGYLNHRVGIHGDGTWLFFVTGD